MEFTVGKPVSTYNGWILESEKWLGSELNEQGSVPRRHNFFLLVLTQSIPVGTSKILGASIVVSECLKCRVAGQYTVTCKFKFGLPPILWYCNLISCNASQQGQLDITHKTAVPSAGTTWNSLDSWHKFTGICELTLSFTMSYGFTNFINFPLWTWVLEFFQFTALLWGMLRVICLSLLQSLMSVLSVYTWEEQTVLQVLCFLKHLVGILFSHISLSLAVSNLLERKTFHITVMSFQENIYTKCV